MANSDQDRSTYDGWVRAYAAELYRYAYRLSGTSHQAEDLVQEAFTEAWKSMNQLRDSARARAWLFQILRRRYSRYLRTQSRRAEGKSPLQEMPQDIRMPEKENPVDQRDWIHVCLQKLDEPARAALLAVMMEGLTCREAATALNVPLGTILSRLHRARGVLREYAERQKLSEPRQGGGRP